MPAEAIGLVRDFMQRHAPPLRVWLAPRAQHQLGAAVKEALPIDAQLMAVPAEDLPPGPAILLATAADLSSDAREALLAAAERALPGRPVICGGTASREILLDAINTWQVFHLLPAHPSALELGDALQRAHHAAALEHTTVLCSRQLRTRCAELRTVQAELIATRDQLLHTERLITVGGFSRALAGRLREHLDHLHNLEDALGSLPDDPRRAELLDFTIQSIRAIDALLADLLAKAEADGAPAP